jgi:hypothetical protein
MDQILAGLGLGRGGYFMVTSDPVCRQLRPAPSFWSRVFMLLTPEREVETCVLFEVKAHWRHTYATRYFDIGKERLFDYDFAAMRLQNVAFREELLRAVMAPQNISRLARLGLIN